MQKPEDFIVKMVSLSGGELVGRVRLQKIAYLLSQTESPDIPKMNWKYHHFGPYSVDLDNAIDLAKHEKRIVEERRARKSDGSLYSIFRLSDTAGGGKKTSAAEPKQLRELVQQLKDETSVVLELAATAHWLSEVEKVSDWRKEIRLRKTWKADDERLEKALSVLSRLHLPPGVKRTQSS